MIPLDLAIRNLFAEFQEAVFRRRALEDSLRQTPTYVGKKIKGRRYWYTQTYEGGQTVQHYVGPATEALNRKVAERRDEAKKVRETLRSVRQVEVTRALLLRRTGLPSLEALTASLMEDLSTGQLIDQQGVLVGTHAFLAYAGILGLALEQSSCRTLDIDIAQETSVKVALIKTKASSDTIFKLLTEKRGLRPVPGLSPKKPPTSFLGSNGLRVDFVTPLRGPDRGPILLPRYRGIAAEPLRFLDYLITDPIRAVLLSPRGGIPVRVPHPARFALHKLIVSTRRPVTESAKKAKDLAQAAQLLEACVQETPMELHQFYQEAKRQGRKWEQGIRLGFKGLPPEIQQKALSILPLRDAEK